MLLGGIASLAPSPPHPSSQFSNIIIKFLKSPENKYKNKFNFCENQHKRVSIDKHSQITNQNLDSPLFKILD